MSEISDRKEMLIKRCNELGITVPDDARISMLEGLLDECRVSMLRGLLDEYMDSAAVVETAPDKVELRQTDEPVEEFRFEVLVRSMVIVKAVSEDAARDWIYKHDIKFHDSIIIDDSEILECDIVSDDY